MNQADVAEAIRLTLMAAEDDAQTDFPMEVSEDDLDTTGHMSDFFLKIGGREFRVRVTEVYR